MFFLQNFDYFKYFSFNSNSKLQIYKFWSWLLTSSIMIPVSTKNIYKKIRMSFQLIIESVMYK